MTLYAKPNRRELQERILFLQLTLAALQAQLDSQGTELDEPTSKLKATETAPVQETPLAIAAG
ncbi:hypothetical protein [Billgrantia aerodenitrificans]|uniref:Uncharacterized protein n=1 Tax=Billgrantia aerodenitrificans TaxID=2733483 RepID=A0ABS9ANH0_9GAMM|nr:hypothetical protein [Halomonas aerodenitrificans]MCE8023383.1 hypothetical protein [Halomonas aerodenitrificans]